MTDRLMSGHIEKKAADFKENGGIKERMTAARLGRRQTQNEEIAALRKENAALKHRIAELEAALGKGP